METKMGNNEFHIKNRKCYYFDDIIKSEDFDFNNILIHGKSQKNVLICDILYKTLIEAKPFFIIDSIK